MNLLYVFYVFQYGRLAKYSNRLMAGPSFSQPNLFCFVLIWSGPITSQENIYPEMDMSRTDDEQKFTVLRGTNLDENINNKR